MKIVVFVISCLLLVVSSIANAQVPIPSGVIGQAAATVTAQPGGPTQMQSKIGGISIGYIRVGSSEVATLDWRPDFKYGPWGLGADVNIGLGEKKPAGYETVVLRYLEYDDSKKGLRYGVLDYITVGHGLIMKNYTTRKGSTILLNNEQMGLKGYYDFAQGAVRGMATRSNIYFARVEERINPMLTLGQHYVTDTTGRSVVQSGGTTKSFPSVSAIGADATMPLPANWEGYAEVGQLMNYGAGLSAGFSWAYDAMVANASFLAEYRMLDKGFVPGYFGADYEDNPVDLASAEASGKAKNGYLAQLGINALGLASLTAIYESYQDSNASLAAALTAKVSEQIDLKGYYKQPNFVDYRSVTFQQGAILGADVAYKINPFTSVIAHYKKAFNPATGQVESTQYYEMGLNF